MKAVQRPDYYKICREERNIAAILYHFLLSDDGSYLNKFLNLLAKKNNSSKALLNRVMENETSKPIQIYFEYAYLRDLWHYFGPSKDPMQSNQEKRCFLKEHINQVGRLLGIDFLEDSPTVINETFGASSGGRESKNHIMSPSRWNLNKVAKALKKEELRERNFETLCKFQWSFNIKPDIVIQLNKKKVVVVEAKLESPQSTYVVPLTEIKHTQVEIQEYMMHKILKFDVFQYILKKSAKQPKMKSDQLGIRRGPRI